MHVTVSQEIEALLQNSNNREQPSSLSTSNRFSEMSRAEIRSSALEPQVYDRQTNGSVCQYSESDYGTRM